MLPLPCLGSSAVGSKSNTLVKLSGNSSQNLPYEAFCQLVFHVPKAVLFHHEGVLVIHLAESAIETLPLFRLVSPQGSSAPELRVALRTFISVDRGQSAMNILDTIAMMLFAAAPFTL